MPADELFAYCARVLGSDETKWTPCPLSPRDVAEALFGLTELIRPRLARLDRLSFKTRFEPEVDTALMRFADSNGDPAVFETMTDGAWRVFAERWVQMEMTAMANAAAGIEVMLHLPAELNPMQRQMALVLYWLVRMPLPWPPGPKIGPRLDGLMQEPPPRLQ